MESTFASIIKELDYNELLYLKKDIKNSKSYFSKTIDKELKVRDTHHERFCTTCGKEIDIYTKHNFTLYFGPEDFKKKASFCAIDCMEYFIAKLKGIKKTI